MQNTHLTGPPRTISRRDAIKLAAAAGMAFAAGTPAAAGSDRMLERRIPSSGEKIPAVGLGTWQTFDVGRDPAERAPLREVLEILFADGGSVIDSSPMYGRSEEVVGDLLAEMGAHDRAFLATKVWTRGKEEGIAQMRQSMERLRAERIELMQVHNLLDWQTHLPTLRAMKEDGQIRYVGITHHTASALDDLAQVIEAEPGIDFVQMSYSLAERDAERRFLPFVAERGVAVLVNEPYGGGALFRAVGDRPLPGWATAFCDSWGQFFLKYILGHPAITCVIPGTSDPEHMRDNLGAGHGRLPDEAERKRMAALWESL